MRNIIFKPVLAVALATASISTAFADPLYASSQSFQDLRPHNDMTAQAYFKFALGGKSVKPKDRFHTGLKLQMRNVLHSQSLRYNSFAYSGGDLNILDMSMGTKGFSSLQLNGVPLMHGAHGLNASEDGKTSINNGLLIAGGIILAIGVGAMAAGGSDDDNDHDRDRDRDRDDRP